MLLSVLLTPFFAPCQKIASKNPEINCCNLKVTESGYSRLTVLKAFVRTLNNLIPEWGLDKSGFYITRTCRISGTFIWDLTDTLNKDSRSGPSCVQFKEGHIYHFSPLEKKYSFSSIAILTKGKIKIYKAINCPEKGDNLKDAIRYIKARLPKEVTTNKFIERIYGYRKYGIYLGVDAQSAFSCN